MPVVLRCVDRTGWMGLALLSLAIGCSRTPVPDYVDSEALSKLPESHQKQIRAQLTHYFGTTANPWLRDMPGEIAGDETAGDTETEQTGDSTEAADGAATDGATAEGAAAEETASAAEPAAPRKWTHAESVRNAGLKRGAQLYRLRCSGCHGISGDGNGPAAAGMQPKPRDYRRGVYKFTATPYGAKPARIDLVRTIRRGAKGTSMPAFPWMSDEDLDDIIDYITLLSQRGELEEYITVVAGEEYDAEEAIPVEDFAEGLATIREAWAAAEGQIVLPVTARPAYNEESIELGRQAFMTQGCAKCHGENGKGQTEWLSAAFLKAQQEAPPDKKIEINYDAWGNPAPAADLTARLLHGGRRPIDIYRRIHTGINGTPMPAFNQAFAEKPETIWHLVHFILSVVEGREIQSSGQAPTTPANDEVAASVRR